MVPEINSPKDSQVNQKTDYGNWVSKRLIYLPGLLALVFLALAIISYYFLIIAVPFLLIAAYFSYAYYKFSPTGGDIQVKIREFVLDRLEWEAGERRWI